MLDCGGKSEHLLKIGDVAMSFTLVTHLTVGVWRGIWTLLDVYVLPSREVLSAFVTVLAGNIVSVTGSCLMTVLNQYVAKRHKVSLWQIFMNYT